MGLVIEVNFAWYDFWVGAYYDRKAHIVYVCPVPMIVFSFWWRQK